ncbi:diphenol oxidase [Rhodotorula toruloides]|uniref:Diphenol oxidase n=1 Tax=Rhodotorula toruloides TaxID=5286 RepID=A0A511KDJ4_RHOTO|nr:diphenol oxidase [Rhodotorula toruloides]
MLSRTALKAMGVAGISLALALALNAPQVAACDLNKCPLRYASCSGIKDVSPVCCPEGCSCARAQEGYAYCLSKNAGTSMESPCCVANTYCSRVQPSWPICDRSPLRSEGPPRRQTSSSASPPVASNRDRVAKFPWTGTEIDYPPAFGSAGSTSKNSGNSNDWFEDDDDEPSSRNAGSTSPRHTAQRPASADSNTPDGAGSRLNAPSSPGSTSPSMASDYGTRRPSGPPMVSKLDELRLSSDWDIHAPPQTREYWWTIAEHPGAPDGYLRPMLLVNGQFPGPLVEANNGDLIVVHVQNSLDQPITIHWHGLTQNGTNWEDGPSGVTQCPIGSGQSYTYQFPITGELEYGTYWWHAHRRALYSDGITGPLIIHSPLDPLIIFINDWYHDTTDTIVNSLLSSQGYNSSFIAPSPQSGLVNGAAIYNCRFAERGSTCEQKTQRDMPELRFPPDARVRLRFINAGAHPVNWVSVDEHELYIIEADNTPTLPVPVHRIPVNVAQRYSGVLLTSGHRIGDSFYLRAQINTACFGAGFPDLDPQTRIIIRIADEGHRVARTLPRSRDWNDPTTGNCTDLDERLLEPIVVQHAPRQVNQISFFNSSLIGPLTTTDAAGLSEGISFLDPLLHQIVRGENPNTGRIALVTAWDVETVDIVIQNLNGPEHPFHLHGKPFWIMARGRGSVGPETVASLDVNTYNPLRRDTLGLPSGEWVLIRLVTDVPGVFAFHCHIVFHQAQGLFGALVVQPDVIRNFKIPEANYQLCAQGNPNMIDPGRHRRRKRLFDLPHLDLLHHHSKTSTRTTAPHPTHMKIRAQEHEEKTASQSTMTHAVVY